MTLSDKNRDGATLSESDIEDGSRLGEVEQGECLIVVVGGRADHRPAKDAPDQA